MENVIVTPHAPCWTDECFPMDGAADVAAVRALMEGSIAAHLVNPEVAICSAFATRLAALRSRVG